MTTILGYSSLLLAKNQGLFLFGIAAVLGEIACLVTALGRKRLAGTTGVAH